MGSILNSPFVEFVAIMLIALVPAYVLGKFLPSDATLKGPFEGSKFFSKLTVSFTGAFALYLFILLLGAGFISTMHALKPAYEEVAIRGVIQLEGANQDDLRSHQLRMVLHPAQDDVSQPFANTLNFTLLTPARRTVGNGFELASEAIIFEYPDYLSQSQRTSSSEVNLDGAIDLGTITMRPKSARLREVSDGGE